MNCSLVVIWAVKCQSQVAWLTGNNFILFFLSFTWVLIKKFTSPGGSTPQSSSCTATYHSSRKLSKLDEPDKRDTAGVVGTSSRVMYFCWLLHMDGQRQDDQLEPTYSSSVPMRDVALRPCRKQWTIGRACERVRDIHADGVTWWWWWWLGCYFFRRVCAYTYRICKKQFNFYSLKKRSELAWWNIFKRYF